MTAFKDAMKGLLHDFASGNEVEDLAEEAELVRVEMVKRAKALDRELKDLMLDYDFCHELMNYIFGVGQDWDGEGELRDAMQMVERVELKK